MGWRDETVSTYAENGQSFQPTSEYFAWDSERWFNVRGIIDDLEQARSFMPDWKEEYFESKFDRSNTWVPSKGYRPTAVNRNAIPHPTPMIPEFNFNSLLGTYRASQSTSRVNNATMSMVESDSSGNPTRLRWTNELGESWDYEPIYNGLDAIWVLEFIDGSALNNLGNNPERLDPAKLWNGELQAYEIVCLRARGIFWAKLSSTSDALPFPDPKILLFKDEFRRDNQLNLNASTGGQSGELGFLEYGSQVMPSGSEAMVQDQRLVLQGTSGDQNSGCSVHIDSHNFSDPAILRSGQLIVKTDVEFESPASEEGRFFGISLGQNLSDVSGVQSMDPAAFSSDLLVTYEPHSKRIEIYKNGTQVPEEGKVFEGSDQPKVMTVHLRHLDSFRVGRKVWFEVYLDDEEQATVFGSFIWGETEQNYIGLHSNLSGGVALDNLEVCTYVTPGIELHSNDFNLADRADLEPASESKTGTLSGVTYEVKSLQGAPLFEIEDTRLVQQGAGADPRSGSLLYLNGRNFSNSEIVENGGFQVGFDIASYETEGEQRHVAIGIGQSLDELSSLTSAAASDSPADLTVAYQLATGELAIYRNGIPDPVATIGTGVPEGYSRFRIKVMLSPDGFAEGAPFYYQVLSGIESKEPIAFGSANWSGASENYISLASNLTERAEIDNFSVRTLDALGTVHADRVINGRGPEANLVEFGNAEDLLRYSFGLDDDGDDLEKRMPHVNDLGYSFTRLKGGQMMPEGEYRLGNVGYRVEVSPSLVDESWEHDPSLYETQVVTDPSAPFLERVTLVPSSEDLPRLFFRMKIVN